MSEREYESELQEFLERLEIEPEDVVSKSAFQKALEDRLGTRQKVPPSQSQIDTMFEVAETVYFNAPISGVREVSFTQRGKQVTRYVIQGQRGLFGIGRVLDFLRGVRR